MQAGPWPASIPESFPTHLLRSARLQRFAPGQVIYRFGDLEGGMYGLVAGSLTINAAPPDAAPRLIHLGIPGAWTGEGPFLTGQPRRIELKALGDAWMMHVPLDALQQMEARDPAVFRVVGRNTVFTVDALIRIVNDLRKRNGSTNSVRAATRGMARRRAYPTVSKRTWRDGKCFEAAVNMTMKRFTEVGWVSCTYRSVTVTNPLALGKFAEANALET